MNNNAPTDRRPWVGAIRLSTKCIPKLARSIFLQTLGDLWAYLLFLTFSDWDSIAESPGTLTPGVQLDKRISARCAGSTLCHRKEM